MPELWLLKTVPKMCSWIIFPGVPTPESSAIAVLSENKDSYSFLVIIGVGFELWKDKTVNVQGLGK